MNGVSCKRAPEGREVALVNFGQWSASGQGHYSLARYSAAVRDWAEAVRSGPDLATFWVETFPYCVKNDATTHGHRDWRTPHRLEAFRRVALSTLQPLVDSGILAGVLDVADIADPIADLCPDGAHLTSPIALIPLLERLHRRLCREQRGNATVEMSLKKFS